MFRRNYVLLWAYVVSYFVSAASQADLEVKVSKGIFKSGYRDTKKIIGL